MHMAPKQRLRRASQPGECDNPAIVPELGYLPPDIDYHLLGGRRRGV